MYSYRDMALGALMVAVVALAYHTLTQQNASVPNAQRAAAASALIAGQSSAVIALASTTLLNPNTFAVDPSQSQSDQSSAQTYYEYKLVFDVDPCTLTILGKGNWEPIEFGKDVTGTGDDLHIASGRDANCSRFGSYQDFIWILFKRATTTPS